MLGAFLVACGSAPVEPAPAPADPVVQLERACAVGVGVLGNIPESDRREELRTAIRQLGEPVAGALGTVLDTPERSAWDGFVTGFATEHGGQAWACPHLEIALGVPPLRDYAKPGCDDLDDARCVQHLRRARLERRDFASVLLPLAHDLCIVRARVEGCLEAPEVLYGVEPLRFLVVLEASCMAGSGEACMVLAGAHDHEAHGGPEFAGLHDPEAATGYRNKACAVDERWCPQLEKP